MDRLEFTVEVVGYDLEVRCVNLATWHQQPLPDEVEKDLQLIFNVNAALDAPRIIPALRRDLEAYARGLARRGLYAIPYETGFIWRFAN